MKAFFSGLGAVVGILVYALVALFLLGVYFFFFSFIGAALAAVLAVCAWIVAKGKNRSEEDWSLGTLLFPPVLLILLCLSSVEPQRKRVKCPHCAEEILAEAKVCKHCGNKTTSLPEA